MSARAGGVTALVVSHDGKEHLRRCLEKLAVQPVDEVIVVDNASSDGSGEMVRRHFPGCRLIALDRNVGFGAANNRGAALAGGELLLLVNSDAWLADGALDRLRNALVADAGAALAAPELRYPDGRPQLVWAPPTGVPGEALQKVRNRFPNSTLNHLWVPRLLQPILGGWFSAACLLVRRTAFEAVSGFDERFFLYFEDADLSRRLRAAGWRLLLVPEALAYHVGGGSRRAAEGEIEYRRAQLLYYRLHRPGWETKLLRRRLRRKFQRLTDTGLRRRLLALL